MKLGTIGTTVSVEPESNVHEVSIPTLESIAYQRNDSFGPDIEALVLKFMEKVKAGATSVQIDSELELKAEFNKLVRKRIGVNAQLYCNGMMAATFPNTYVAHSPVVNDSLRDYLEYDQGAAGAVRLRGMDNNRSLGTVDTEKAKLTGWLSEQEVAIYINFNQLMEVADFSSAEITAIVLHELGHDFEGAAMCARATHTNLIIADIAKRISGGSTGVQEYVYKELSKIDKDIPKDTVEGLMSTNPVVMGVALYRLAQGSIRSLSGSRVYERTNYEALSDSFATRFGYGAPLASGLEKLIVPGLGSDVVIEVIVTLGAISLCATLIKLLGTLFVGTVTAKLVISIVVNAMSVGRLINANRTTNADMTYDESYDRFARIKKDLINNLKDAKIKAKEKKEILEQLAVVDKAMTNVFNTPRPIRALVNLIIRSEGRSQRSMDAQKQLENIIANDIFVSANKLALKSA